jgi:transposase
MSLPTIAAYFPFRRIKIVNQAVTPEATEAHIEVQPDKRFQPICHGCGKRASGVHSWSRRKVRDLHFASARLWLTCQYRKVFCAHCQGIHIEDLELFHPYLRMTNRLALYVYQLCQYMTVSEVARHLGLNWKTVKAIDKFYLQRDYGQLDYQGLRLLAVDEISIRKGQRYLTVVLDYLSGRVVFVGKERKAKTLERFFNKLTVKQRKAIEAIVMDMWDPYIKAVKKNCLRLKSSSICSTLWPILTSLSIRSESANIVRPPNRTRLSIKVQGTCCLKTAKTCDA